MSDPRARALLWRLLRDAGGWLLAAWALLALTWIAGIALLALSGWFVTATALAAAGLLLGLDVFLPSTGIRAAAVLRTVARYGERVLGHEAVLRLLARLRRDSFAALAALPAQRQRAWRSADLQARLGGDVDSLDLMPLRVAGPVVAAAAAVVLAAGVAAWLAPAAAAALLLGVGLAAFSVSALAARAGRDAGRELVQARSRQRIGVLDHIGGLAELVAYRRDIASRERLDRLDRTHARRLLRRERIEVLGEQGTQALVAGASLAMLVLALHWYQLGVLGAPVAVLLALMTLGLGEALGSLPGACWRVGECAEAARRLVELGVGRRDAAPQASDGGARPDPEGRGDGAAPLADAASLVARSLVVGHGPRRPLATFAQLTLAPGRPLVVEGPSGVGKSSLLDTLAGELAPLAGTLELGGRPYADWPVAARVQAIGYLPQRLRFIDASVAANLRLADPRAGDARLAEALVAACLEEFAEPGPHGLGYRLGEDASRLSGGQARRLGLAWLWLRDPVLALLDEPFAGLDRALERELLARLAPWLRSRCCILVSHAAERLPADWPRLRLPPTS